MKKIVFLEHTLNAGGAERVTATIMRSLDPSKFEIHLLIVSKLGELGHLVPEHVKIHELGITHTRDALFSLRKLLKNIKPTTIYASLPNTASLLIFSSYGLKIKKILRYPNLPSRQTETKDLYGWRLIVSKLIYNKSDVVVSQNIEMAKELQQFYKIDKEKIKVIMNPVDTKHIDESVENSENPFGNGKINIVASGRMHRQKGFDVLVESFAKAVAKNGDFHLHILGRDVDGNLQKLEKRISELKITNNITFYGFQKNPYPFYKFCDLFVLSSRWEGLPNVVLECQYLGKPIVATRCIPVIERLIDDGKNGFVVDVEDIDGLANAILNFKQLKGEQVFRDSISEFQKIFEDY
jgi:glycosyltransferase involved in cell wall biosynthesis